MEEQFIVASGYSESLNHVKEEVEATREGTAIGAGD